MQDELLFTVKFFRFFVFKILTSSLCWNTLVFNGRDLGTELKAKLFKEL